MTPFFALLQDFVKTPFLKDVPSEIAVLGSSGVPKTPLKTSPEQGPKRTLKQYRQIVIVLSMLKRFFGSSDGFLAYLGALGPKGRPRQPQDRPRQAQDRPRQAKTDPRQAQDRPKTGPRQAKTGQDRPKTSPRQPKTGPRRYCRKSL